ncbi:MAG: Hpt domain-containing protein [Pirellulaceae bacterium]|nr:Hpt domain-containing protein [Pirellulaceae bacterium]
MNRRPDLNSRQSSRRLDPPIDFQRLLHRCRGNERLVRQLVATFQQKIDEDVALLEGALDRKDASEIAAVAHRVKGTAANIAADGIREAAEEIEQSAWLGEFAQIPQWLLRFKVDGSRLAQILNLEEGRFETKESQ